MRTFASSMCWLPIAVWFMVVSGCASPAPEPQREIAIEIAQGDHQLRVIGTGGWHDGNVTLRVEYRSGAGAAAAATLELARWDSSSWEPLAAVDPDFLRYVVQVVDHAGVSTGDFDLDRLHHDLARIARASLPDATQFDSHGPPVPEDSNCEQKCYCPYCGMEMCGVC